MAENLNIWPGIYILHASDLHLAKSPLRQSILDQTSIMVNVVKNFYHGLDKNLLSGELRNLKETFAGVLSQRNIGVLENTQSLADDEDLNAKIDTALKQLALSEDPFFRDFLAEITRTVSSSQNIDTLRW